MENAINIRNLNAYQAGELNYQSENNGERYSITLSSFPPLTPNEISIPHV